MEHYTALDSRDRIGVVMKSIPACDSCKYCNRDAERMPCKQCTLVSFFEGHEYSMYEPRKDGGVFDKFVQWYSGKRKELGCS